VRVYNAQAEKLLLCAMLERRRLRQYALQHLHEDLFGSDVIREIYIRMQKLMEMGKPVPSVSVMVTDPGLSPAASTALKLNPRERAKLVSFKPSDVDHSLDQIRYYYQVRVLYETQKWIAEQFETPAQVNMDEMKAEIQQRLLSMDVYDEVSENLQIIGHGGNISDDYLREQLSRKRKRTVPTGYSVIDDKAKWSRGNMVLLTAKRGQGKSLLAKSLGLSHFRQGQNVLTVNMEMERWEYLCRLFAQETPFTHDQLREGLATSKQIEKAVAAKKRLDRDGMAFRDPDTGELRPCRWGLRTITRPNYTPAMLHNELRYQGYDVVIIDYINLFKQENKDLWASLYSHTKYLKMMAKDLGILLYILAQLTDEGRAKYARAAEEDSDAWLYWEINRGTPSVKMFHGKARHYKPYSFPLVFRHYNMEFAEEIDIGLVCSNDQCRSTFKKQDPKGKDDGFEDAKPVVSHDELDDISENIAKYKRIAKNQKKTERQRQSAKVKLKELTLRGELLEAGICPNCRRKVRGTNKVVEHRLVDEMMLLEELASKDEEEHQHHVDELEAARKGKGGTSDRRLTHQDLVSAQTEGWKDNDSD